MCQALGIILEAKISFKTYYTTPCLAKKIACKKISNFLQQSSFFELVVFCVEQKFRFEC